MLFRARNFNIAESVRRLNADLVTEAAAALRKAAALRDVVPLKELDLPLEHPCVFIPAYRRDGVGIQALVRICIMFLSRQVSSTYIHLPFLELQHQFNDPIGRSLSRLEWAEKWETFLNLGQDEYYISDLARQVGPKSIAIKMADENRQFGKPGMPSPSSLSEFLDGSSRCDSPAKDLNVFDLRFFRDALAQSLPLSIDSGLAFDAPFVEQLQAKFDANGYVPSEELYSDQYLEIAIHIRRGDIWESFQAGDQRWEEKIRFVSEGYFVDLLQRLQALSYLSSKPIRFHIFSDGQSADFPQFTFVSEREAYLALASGERIENIQFHLSQNSLDALYHLVKAPVLVPSKSSFSFLAVLLGKSYVLYDDTIYEFYQYDFLKDYMQCNARFILLSNLKEQVDCFV